MERLSNWLTCQSVNATFGWGLWQVTRHHKLLQNNHMLRHLIEMRNPFIDPINILQVPAP